MPSPEALERHDQAWRQQEQDDFDEWQDQFLDEDWIDAFDAQTIGRFLPARDEPTGDQS